jgi:hypothetical protein
MDWFEFWRAFDGRVIVRTFVEEAAAGFSSTADMIADLESREGFEVVG